MAQKRRAVPAIHFRGRLMTPSQIYHEYGRDRGLSYQTIRKRIGVGERDPATILRRVQLGSERRAYAAKYSGETARALDIQKRAHETDHTGRQERMRKLAKLLRGAGADTKAKGDWSDDT